MLRTVWCCVDFEIVWRVYRGCVGLSMAIYDVFGVVWDCGGIEKSVIGMYKGGGVNVR